MTKREAKALGEQIEKDMPSVHVTGYRHYPDGGYAVECVETKNGVPFTVFSAEDWRERLLNANLTF